MVVEDPAIAYWESTEACGGHSERFAYLLKSKLWSDVTFMVGKDKEEVKAHKSILGFCSKVFNDLFNEDKEKSVFEVPDLEPAGFCLLLKFLYTGECNDTVKDALTFLDAAVKYEAKHLLRHCNEMFAEALNADNAVKIYQMALKIKDERLAEKALKCVCRNGNKIIKTVEFTDLSVEELRSILSNDGLNVPREVELFEAVVSWGKAECRRRVPSEPHPNLVLKEVIDLIRFTQMNPMEFTSTVIPTHVLRDEDVVTVLRCIFCKERLMDIAPSSIETFNSKPRIAFDAKRNQQEFILPRLTRNFTEDIMHLRTNSKVWYHKHIPNALGIEHFIRLKSSMPVLVKSVGMNTTAAYVSLSSSDTVTVQIQLKDAQNNVLAMNTTNVGQVRYWTSAVAVRHIKFVDPVKLRKDNWYILSFIVVAGNFYGDNFTALNGHGTTMDYTLSDGRMIKFEFSNDENPMYTGVTQGFIPEIGFLVD